MHVLFAPSLLLSYCVHSNIQHTATSLNQHATVVMAEQIIKNKKENLELQQKRRQEEGDAGRVV